jgi:NADH:ubiquinone oxidoreductase subunit 3 (subunit A)
VFGGVIQNYLFMALYFSSYFALFLYFLISLILAFVFFSLSYFVALQKGDIEKLSAYECGFDPFDDARNTFDVRFYLVAILFIIFDLEISFFFPWSIVINTLPLFAFWSMMVFLTILTVGFIYEWKKGALEWE